MSRMGNNPIPLEGIITSILFFLAFTAINFSTSIYASRTIQAATAVSASSAVTSSEKTLVGIFYVNQLFSNIHQHPVTSATSLMALSCGTPLKVYETNSKVSPDWSAIIYDNNQGFIQKKLLDNTRPLCFQDRYPKFFNQINLDLTQMYYWGKLYDQYVMGKVRVK